MDLSRRRFLRQATQTVGASLLARSAFARTLLTNSASSSNSYKALVCIDLDGGSDGNNVFVPLGAAQYARYSAARGTLAISPKSLLTVGDGKGGAYGFHPSLGRIRSQYLAGTGAVVANVGPLITDVDRATALSQTNTLPGMLEDHEVQRAIWAAGSSRMNTQGSMSGWGGRIADTLSQANTSTYPLVTCVTSSDQFTIGDATFPVGVTPGGGGGFPTDSRSQNLQLIASLTSGNVLVGAASKGLKDGMQQSQLLQSALASGTAFKTVFPTSSIGAQLQQVALIIAVRSALGMNRQIFLCKQLDYDNHSNQLATHAGLLSDLDQAVGAFCAFLVELGLMENVTVFTQSDFGRSLAINSSFGTDHAWGNHQIVIGGAVKGNKMYGVFPDFDSRRPRRSRSHR